MGTLCDYICSSNTCNSKGVVLEQQNSATSKRASEGNQQQNVCLQPLLQKRLQRAFGVEHPGVIAAGQCGIRSARVLRFF